MQQKPNHQPLFKWSKWVSKYAAAPHFDKLIREPYFIPSAVLAKACPQDLGSVRLKLWTWEIVTAHNGKPSYEHSVEPGLKVLGLSPLKCWGQRWDSRKMGRSHPDTLEVSIIAALGECWLSDDIIADFIFLGLRSLCLDWLANRKIRV